MQTQDLSETQLESIAYTFNPEEEKGRSLTLTKRTENILERKNGILSNVVFKFETTRPRRLII